MLRINSRAAMTATAHLDAVLVPTLAQLPALVGQLRDDDDPAADFAAQVAYSPYCAGYNISGQPAINVPMNWNSDGLPVGFSWLDECTTRRRSFRSRLSLRQPMTGGTESRRCGDG